MKKQIYITPQTKLIANDWIPALCTQSKPPVSPQDEQEELPVETTKSLWTDEQW